MPERQTVIGLDVIPGDVLHDHDDAVVVTMAAEEHPCEVVSAVVRRPNGSLTPAYWGKRAEMSVTRTPTVLVGCPPCPFCRRTQAISVPADGYERWVTDTPVQEAFPGLTKEERELLVTGIHKDCWDTIFDIDDDPELSEGWD